MLATPASRRLAVVAFAVLAAAAPGGQRFGGDAQVGHTISGRVVDPQQLRPEGAILMLGQPAGPSSFGSTPGPIAADGSFTTARLKPGVYVVALVRTPHSATKPATVVAQTIVRLAGVDVSNITVTVRPDSTLTGRFRMESDNPQAVWPTHVNVLAFLAVDGLPMAAAAGAQGGPNGTFILRNILGPRVLRCGYVPAPGSSWWPSRVVLDGRDVTNVPTDFSAHPHGQLEVVFTQHPARLTGTVTDAAGQPVPTPWVLVAGRDPAAAHIWATTSDVTQADRMGRFAIAVSPGAYRVHAVPAAMFASREAARSGMSRIVFGGVPALVKDRERTVVTVTLQER
jgi:hypothetical protein